MNQLMMVVVVLVVFCYFGGKYCPSVLKKNKELLLGVAGGLVLCSFFGVNIEGFWKVDYQGHTCSGSTDLPEGETAPPPQKIIDAAATACQKRLEDENRHTTARYTCLNNCGLAFEQIGTSRQWKVIRAEGTPPTYRPHGNTWQ